MLENWNGGFWGRKERILTTDVEHSEIPACREPRMERGEWNDGKERIELRTGRMDANGERGKWNLTTDFTDGHGWGRKMEYWSDGEGRFEPRMEREEWNVGVLVKKDLNHLPERSETTL